MAMPTLNDLQGMYGLGDPRAYMQARDNAGLERQFREQQYAQEQAKAQEASLKNIWDTEDRPRKVEEQVLKNRNLDYTGQGIFEDNRTRRVGANVAEATQQYKLNEAQRKELLAIPEQDIAMGERTAQQMMQSLDPEVRKRGEQLYGFTKFSRDEKAKNEHAMALQRMKEEGDTKRTGMTTATQLKIANLNNDRQDARAATKAGSTGPQDIMALLQTGKISPERAITALNAAAITEQDEGRRDMILTLARTIEQFHRQGPAPAGGGKVQVEGMERTPPAPLATPAPGGSVDPKKTQGVKSLADLQGMYPGVPAAKLKELYKKKFGVDLQ